MKKFFNGISIATLGLAITFSMAIASPAAAKWPNKPVELVCATSPKSGAAVYCRLIAGIMSKQLGERVVPLFKGGGGGNTAAAYVAKKPTDGYTFLHRNTSYAGYMNMPTFKPDPNMFEVVVHFVKFIFVIGTRADSKYKTFKALIKDMKANPGKISVAANKPGSAHHQHLLNVFKAYNVKWNYVPYKGSGRAMKDVLGGHVPVGIVPTAIWTPHVKSGKARTLLVLNEKRYPGVDAPTPAELGVNYDIKHQVQGFFLKKGVPEDVKKQIRKAFKNAAESKEYKSWIKKTVGAINVFNTDGPALTKHFHQIRMETGAFLKEHGLIKKKKKKKM